MALELEAFHNQGLLALLGFRVVAISIITTIIVSIIIIIILLLLLLVVVVVVVVPIVIVVFIVLLLSLLFLDFSVCVCICSCAFFYVGWDAGSRPTLGRFSVSVLVGHVRSSNYEPENGWKQH